MSGTGTPVFRIEGDRVSIVTYPYTPEVAGLDFVEEPVNDLVPFCLYTVLGRAFLTPLLA